MSLLRAIRFAALAILLTLSFSGVARAQCPECGSALEIDPAVALNAFALLSGAIVVLFETYRSRP